MIQYYYVSYFKYSKKVTLILGKDTWFTEDWALALLLQLDLINWGLSGELITDRDLKFFSQFWTSFFNKLGVQMLYSTTYHLQTDSFSKQTNQTIEIALRFFVHDLDKPSMWPTALLAI